MSDFENAAFPAPRTSAPGLDAILGKPFKVLDDGFVRAVDYMGSDASIVQAARVSYGAGTKKASDDEHLIRYLMRHRHTTPFEMCELKLHVRVPMDIWRQWVRHRTASINEYSTRYSIAIDSAHATAPDAWRLQSATNRQGSDGLADPALGQALTADEAAFHAECRRIYLDRIERGIAREQARKDLPLSTYTEAYWKCDLHNLLRFLSLRMEGGAQLEIREYAATIGHEIVSRWVPFAWKAFKDYTLDAIALSRHERALLGMIARGETEPARAYATDNGLVRDGKPGREIRELEGKLADMGIQSPWA
ncbi:MAG: FAD-dependent thymidylate synthase [Kiritimatiellia bacterium]|jgi:thymidylate synthase (FAD)